MDRCGVFVLFFVLFFPFLGIYTLSQDTEQHPPGHPKELGQIYKITSTAIDKRYEGSLFEARCIIKFKDNNLFLCDMYGIDDVPIGIPITLYYNLMNNHLPDVMMMVVHTPQIDIKYKYHLRGRTSATSMNYDIDEEQVKEFKYKN